MRLIYCWGIKGILVLMYTSSKQIVLVAQCSGFKADEKKTALFPNVIATSAVLQFALPCYKARYKARYTHPVFELAFSPLVVVEENIRKAFCHSGESRFRL